MKIKKIIKRRKARKELIMQKQLQIFTLARICADTYKRKYNKADKERKDAWNDLNRNFLKGSPKFIKYRDSIEPEFQSKIQKAREELTAEFETEYEELRKIEIDRVKSIGSGSEKIMDVLGRLENIPISVDEFSYLIEQYGNHGYWTDRYLASIGQKNGMQECDIQPDITTKLSVLKELKSNLYGYFDKYKNDNSYSSDVLVADVTFQRLEKRYTNNYAGISLNGKESGKRIALEGLNKTDELERSMYLANALNTATPEVQEGILLELVKNHSEIADNSNIRLAGISKAMENFKETEYKGMCKAEQVIKKIKGESREYEQKTIIYNNLEDKHFIDAVAQSEDDNLKKLVKHMREVKKAGEEKEQREAAQSGNMTE